MAPPQSAAVPSEPMRSFEAERRRHLIEATIETVSDVGFKAASLGEIARRAGVSQGLFAHYFGDKDGLLEATLRFMAARLARATAARLRAARTPLERVLAVPESALAPEEFDPRTSAVWLAFWGQIMHSEPYRRVQSIYQQRMRANLRYGLRPLVDPARLEISVSFIAATIDGLWLQSHSTGVVRSDGSEARSIVRELVTLLIAREGASSPASVPAQAAAPSTPARSWRSSDAGGSLAWRTATRGERGEVLRRVALRLRDERKAIARLEARDTGRPVADVEAHDLPRVIRAFERAAEQAAAPAADHVDFGGGRSGWADRCPPASILAPAHWSAPLLLASRGVGPALAEGATAVACSAARKTRALSRLAAIAREAGAPEGAFEVLGGDDADRAARAAGGPSVGWADAPRKSAVLVTDDADVARAAFEIARGARRFARARALSETIVFVAEAARQTLVERLRAEMAALAMGDPMDPAVEVGPMASRDQLERALALIEAARRDGARVKLGGRAEDPGARSRAAFLKPTLLDDGHEDMAIARAPVFAPIVLTCGVATNADAAARLRALGPGLSLGVYVGDVARARRLARDAEAAVCRINDWGRGFAAAEEDWLDPGASVYGRVRRTLACDADAG
ncbi:transcriptional regulator BetI [Methylopila sp. Yamaguchi]|uniref:transcriptional regulator BetI n=1 Tax=Methylopila sp. Yamaguchi TaxID=1437817 RepID=UPI001FCE684C|nr:transcriptional regulator BetI [Methylopila sp. Yamaguchi]